MFNMLELNGKPEIKILTLLQIYFQLPERTLIKYQIRL